MRGFGTARITEIDIPVAVVAFGCADTKQPNPAEDRIVGYACTITVKTDKGMRDRHACRRFREWCDLRAQLLKIDPNVRAAPFPSRAFFGSVNDSRAAIERRRAVLATWVKAIAAHECADVHAALLSFLSPTRETQSSRALRLSHEDGRAYSIFKLAPTPATRAMGRLQLKVSYGFVDVRTSELHVRVTRRSASSREPDTKSKVALYTAVHGWLAAKTDRIPSYREVQLYAQEVMWTPTSSPRTPPFPAPRQVPTPTPAALTIVPPEAGNLVEPEAGEISPVRHHEPQPYEAIDTSRRYKLHDGGEIVITVTPLDDSSSDEEWDLTSSHKSVPAVRCTDPCRLSVASSYLSLEDALGGRRGGRVVA